MRDDGCTANTLASYRGVFADWLDLSWFRGSDWGIAREALYNVTTGELLTGEEDSAVSACGVGVACLQSRQDSRSVLYDLNSGEAVELGRFDWCVMDYTPGCVTSSAAMTRITPTPSSTSPAAKRPPSSGATRTTTPVMSLC